MVQKDLRLGGVIILFDRYFGASFFQDFMGYSSLIDDAEWLLERTPQRSWGFIIRPIKENERYGLWIGEYSPSSNQIIRQEIIFNRGSSVLSKTLFGYAEHKIDERKVSKRINLDLCKKRLSNSEIVNGFKYYTCPNERFHHGCPHIERIYKDIKEKYGKSGRVHYSLFANTIMDVKLCEDVILCPLFTSPNAFEMIINLNRALRSQGLGEIKIVDQNKVEIV